MGANSGTTPSNRSRVASGFLNILPETRVVPRLLA